ncbi:MAG: ATP-binding protein [Candidatus Gastranaerophilales bacterium]|nr:ATP-binding protein [Candidatus Gastranaerophilales bacterium]
MLWYVINLFIIFIFIALFLIFRKSSKRWSKINDYLGMVNNTVNSIRYGNLTTKIENLEHPNYQNLSASINRMVETLNDREKMIVEYQGELTRQNKFLEAVINSLSDGILIIDDNYNILRVTPQIANWFGEDGKNLLNKNVLEYIQPKNHVKCEKFKEEEIFVRNVSDASFEATTMKLNLDDKKKRFVMIIKDITNQKELEKLREDFVATLTHDLKVPIVAETNILDFLVNGKFGEINEKQYEAISNMKDCNEELLELVQILLETYKINQTEIILNKEKINLVPFISNIIEEMQPITEKSDLKINFHYQDDAEIFADSIQLTRVIKNLIQNAISYSETNRDIDVKLEKSDNFVNISIKDYGKGISQENVEKIFNKYYSTAKKFRKIGTGLGLYLSQQIIKAHGGEITVKSEENVFTEFCVSLQ